MACLNLLGVVSRYIRRAMMMGGIGVFVVMLLVYLVVAEDSVGLF
jgi:hypothetical protein